MKSPRSRPAPLAVAVLSAVVAAVLTCAAGSARAAGAPSANVAWLPAAADADIEHAFVRARAQRKPVLLYWGASWCPPCNQLAATLFNRQDFAELSKGFVAVHVDGDRPGAQKLGQRFKVGGYPTLVLFSAAGAEITRLPGEADAPQVLALLQQGLAGGRPIKAVLADALGGKSLTAADWRMLAFYSWDTDEGQLVPKAEVPGLLARLAASAAAAGAGAGAGEAEPTTRLWLRALAASDDGKGVRADDALRQRVQHVLADPAAARSVMDVLTNGAPEIVQALEDELSPRRAALLASYDTAMKRLEADATLARADRLGALIARIQLARLAEADPEQGRVHGPSDGALRPKLPAALLAELRAFVAAADREIRDGYERQAVITTAAYALGRAGLWSESDALLRSNLARSHAPYYLMSQLGANARKLGRNDEALRWYAQAFEKSQGPATRLQWGAGYLAALIELAPGDATRIEKVASQLLREAGADSATFEGRSARSLARAGSKLAGWGGAGRHAAVMRRLQAQLDGLCAKVEAARRADCAKLLLGAPGAGKDA
ncbi:MAG: thioredoxin family protein [Proteobacteria bacterium]|nr:thioredoxin family protein [Pseudomonadota bacterium]